MARIVRLFAIGVMLLALGAGVAACSGENSPVTTGAGGGETTQTPDTTQAPR